MKLNMDFGLTEEQDALCQLARRILTDRMTPGRLKELDASDDWFDRDTWAALADANLIGVAVPEAHGGLGFGFLEACLLLVEQGRTVAPLPLLPTLIAAAAAARFGHADQVAETGAVARGEAVWTLALNEAGAPLDAPAVTATPDGPAWVLTGTKVNVPAAHLAAQVLVPAAAGDDIAVFWVPTDAPGASREHQDTMSHEPQFVIHLDGVRVPDAAMLGDTGHGREILEWILARYTVGLCALAAGAAERALRLTAEYTTTRKQFDRAIGTFQAVGQRLADAYIDTEAINLTMLAAATHLAEDQPAALEVATAKFWASEAGSRVGHAALHVHGGISIDVDYPIHRYFLWLKQIEYTLGAARPQLARIGAILAHQPA